MKTPAPCRIALAAVALLAAGAALPIPPVEPPQTPAPAATDAAAEPAPPAAPRAIPLEQVFRAADELDATMRKAEGAAAVDPDVEEVERRLASSSAAGQRLREDLDPRRLHESSAREIAWLRQAVQQEDQALAEAQSILEARARALSGVTQDLQVKLASWQLTAGTASAERAPEAVLVQVARAEESLRTEAGRMRVLQDRLFEVQGRVSALRGEFARWLVSLDGVEATLDRQLFEAESAPLWRALAGPDSAVTLGGHLRQALRESRRDVASFRAEEGERPWIHVLVIAVLGVGLFALRRPVAAMQAGGAALRGPDRMLSRPWSAALLLSLPFAAALYGPLPPTFSDLFALLLLAPLLRLLPGLVPEVFRRPIYGLAALFALGRLAAIAPPRTLLARLLVLLLTAGALAAFVHGLRPGGWARFLRRDAWGLATRGATVTGVGLLVVSAASSLIGNATLAARLTQSTIGSATLAALLVGLVTVLEGTAAALLCLPAVRRRPIVARHGDLLLRRAAALLRAAGVALWAWMTARSLGVDGTLQAAGGAVLGLRLQVGGLDVSLGNVVAFAVTLGAAVLLARALRFVLDEGVFPEVSLPRGLPAAVTKTAQYFVLVIGFSWAVLASGMEMSRFSFIVGALGVGIGFGLQNVVNNFVSGLILVYERPVQVGDIVEVGAVSGEVRRIGVRSSTVRTFLGAEVIVPNATLIAAEVTNWTLSDRRRRIDLAVGVAYGTDPKQVIELLLGVVRGRAGVLLQPAPMAIFLRFGDSAIQFELRFWTADFDRWVQLASDVLIEVHASLGRAGIEIPFPQRDLHVRSMDPEAARAIAESGKGRGTTA